MKLLQVITGLIVILSSLSSASGGLIPYSTTGTPQDSWAYYELPNAGHGQSTSYFPTTTAEYLGAVFQGYVTYNIGSPPSYWFGQGSDSIQVFSTYVQSPVALNLPLFVGGDDGHSLFIDGVFAGGGGFGANVIHNLVLQPGVPVLIELVGYNGPGPFTFSIRIAPNNDTLLDDVPGLLMNANGLFATVPEPASMLAWMLIGGAATLTVRRRGKSPIKTAAN